MAYHIYTTTALVCGNFNRNTSDKFYYLFTQDAGMVIANAKSVREEKSKHRFALQDFSIASVSLVRGKSGWKITGSVPGENLYFETKDRDIRSVILNTTGLLRRLIQGEENHPNLFLYLTEGLKELTRRTDIDPAQSEQVLTIKMLHALGYVAPTDTLERVLSAPTFREGYETLEYSKEIKKEIQKAIDEALLVAHL